MHDPEAVNLPAEFWGDPNDMDALFVRIQVPKKPLAILEKLGPSPFERGGFPLVGFLATTYDKVSQFALERSGYQSQSDLPAASSPDIHVE